MSQDRNDPKIDIAPDVAERIRTDAILRTRSLERHFDLYMSRTIREGGETLGPAVQGIRLEQASALVFVDEEPAANFGHACHYLLYEPEKGRFRKSIGARFPPYAQDISADFTRFSQGYNGATRPNQSKHRHHPMSVRSLNIGPAAGYDNRYAILFSGLPYLRHVNELELCYRALTGTYGFEPGNIFVLLFSGQWRTVDADVPSSWPTLGGTPYQLKSHSRRAGTLPELAKLFAPGALPLTSKDLLFIHMTGDGDSDAGGAFINTYDGVYRASQMAVDIQGLPAHRALLVLMEQCSAGGFCDAVIANSRATMTNIAAAAKNGEGSHISEGVPQWNYFAAEWLSAHMGLDILSGAPVNIVVPPALVDADKAYHYAVTSDPADTPTRASAGGGGNITLA